MQKKRDKKRFLFFLIVTLWVTINISALACARFLLFLHLLFIPLPARDKGQGTRDKGQGTRDKGQGTRDKGRDTKYPLAETKKIFPSMESKEEGITASHTKEKKKTLLPSKR